MRERLLTSIGQHQGDFGLDLSEEAIGRLADYYELVQKHNPILHLVGPCSPEEFATRHILESLTLLKHLPVKARFADVGTGAGLPSIPCLIARDDLRGILIESKDKKANFLLEAVTELGIADRARIVNRQFSETSPSDAQHIVCRALDRFTQKLPQLLQWSARRDLLLYGGPSLEEALVNVNRKFSRELMPLSERRYLFHVQPATI